MTKKILSHISYLIYLKIYIRKFYNLEIIFSARTLNRTDKLSGVAKTLIKRTSRHLHHVVRAKGTKGVDYILKCLTFYIIMTLVFLKMHFKCVTEVYIKLIFYNNEIYSFKNIYIFIEQKAYLPYGNRLSNLLLGLSVGYSMYIQFSIYENIDR